MRNFALTLFSLAMAPALALVMAVVTAVVSGGTAHAAPRVIVSIKPVHALAAGVMAGVGTPELLLTAAASPHHQSLKPSQASRLSGAEIVIWIGPTAESRLTRSIANLAAGAVVLQLDELAGLTLYLARAGGVFSDHHDDHKSGDHKSGKQGSMDPHFWLDIDNAVVITRALGHRMSALDPGNADAYRANADQEITRLEKLRDQLARRLAPLAGKPMIVVHDAFQYLERRYHIRAIGALGVDAERRAGPKRLIKLRHEIRDHDAVCLLLEPGSEPPALLVLREGVTLKTVVLDPIGVAVPPGPSAYRSMMSAIADQLLQCL